MTPVRPQVTLIAAVARNGVIGHDNQLLWHLPEDMKHFRSATSGHAVLMGRRTWESLPERFRPLHGRRNLVLTRQPGWQAAGAEVVHSVDEALQRVAGLPQLFVIGGAAVYALALPLADELLLTEIEREYTGDIRFPPLPPAFREVERECRQAAPPNDFGYCFVRYRRDQPPPG